MTKFARNTKVPVDRSEAEVKKLVLKYGAKSFASGFDSTSATVMFEMNDRRVRFVMPMVKVSDQAKRVRWRSLVLIIKAKLEAVDSGITMFESEFLAHIVMPNGQTVGDALVPRLAGIYSGEPLPPLLGSAP